MSCAVTKVLELFPGSKVLSGCRCVCIPTGERVSGKKKARRGSGRRTKAGAGAPELPSLRVRPRLRTPKTDRGGALSRATV
jgi:hypothetical protein